MSLQVREFPLFAKAQQAGILETGTGLIVAPTGTGKSFIGRTILRQAVGRREPELHAYLVPYRSLAAEIADALRRELECEGLTATLKVATGDHNDPFHPEETDILVATYERFAGLMTTASSRLGRLIVDEVHFIADETRGPTLETLLVRVKGHLRPRSLCALSAMIANPRELADWLEVPLLVGDPNDRTVGVEFRCELARDPDATLRRLLESILKAGEQAIVFCHSKAAAQRLARELGTLVAPYLNEADKTALRDIAGRALESDEEADEAREFLSNGVAFHHAGLTRELRKAVETAFRERHLKVIACTPTLAAGVNLPASLVVVRDVFRTELIRGYPRRVLLSTGELLNMLGRAGRPGQVRRGLGVALIAAGSLREEDVERLHQALTNGRGDRVVSRLAESFDTFMRFLLAIAVDGGEVTRSDLARAVTMTFWHRQRPAPVQFGRPLREDVMEDIPAYGRVTPAIRVEQVVGVSDGVVGTVKSGRRRYSFGLRISGLQCDCPARSQWRPQEICKHLACAIHTLLFARSVSPEIRSRALYAFLHHLGETFDLGTRMEEAVNLLVGWGLLERVPGGYRATSIGTLAAGSYLDLLLIWLARERLAGCRVAPSVEQIASWLIMDYFTDEKKRDRWLEATRQWLNEVDIKRIQLPEKFRGDFERGLEELGQVAMLYGAMAESLGMPEVAEICRTTRGCLLYGVRPELVPLMSLRIPRLGRARCRFLYDHRGIRSGDDLASADPKELAGPRAPLAFTQQWVEAARRIQAARARVEEAPPEVYRREIDRLLSEYQIDQLALLPD